MPVMQQVFSWDDFTGGENVSVSPGRVPALAGRKVSGFRCDINGRLRLSRSPVTAYTPGVTTRKVTRFNKAGFTRLVYSNNTSLGGGLFATAIFSVDETNLGGGVATVYTLPNTSTLAYDDVQFAQCVDALFFTDPGPNGELYVWYGNAAPVSPAITIATPAGLPAPTVAPTLTLSGAGVLAWTPNRPIPYYQWVFTYVNSHGQESNAGPASALSLFQNEAALVHIGGPHPANTDIQTIRIYRRGGYTTDYYLVGEIAFGTTTFIDNTADIDQSTTLVPRNNFQPPTGLESIFNHRNRLWASKNITLYFSGIDRFEEWGLTQDGAAIDGGYLTLPGASDDPILTLNSTGSLLVIGRKRSVYTLFGNRFDQFTFSPRARVGVASRYAMCRAYNDVYFLGTDRKVYQLTDGNLEPISKPIQRDLYAMTQAQIESARLAFADSRMVLTFTTGTDVAYVYDFDAGGVWTEETGLLCRDLVAAPHPTEMRDEFLLVPVAGTTVKRLFDSYVAKTVDYQSGEVYMGQGRPGATLGTAEQLIIEGAITQGGTPLKARVFADSYSRDYALSGTSGVLLDTRLHPDLVGRFLSVELLGQISAGEITRVALAVSVEREDE